MRRLAIQTSGSNQNSASANWPSELRQRVEPLHVRHLVHEHEAAALLRPLVGIVGKEHDGIDDAPRDRNAEPIAAEQGERTIDVERVASRCASESQPPSSTRAPRRASARDDDRADGEARGGRRRRRAPRARAAACGSEIRPRRGAGPAPRRRAVAVTAAMARSRTASRRGRGPLAATLVGVDTRAGAGARVSIARLATLSRALASGSERAAAHPAPATCQRGPQSANTAKQELHGDRADPDACRAAAERRCSSDVSASATSSTTAPRSGGAENGAATTSLHASAALLLGGVDELRHPLQLRLAHLLALDREQCGDRLLGRVVEEGLEQVGERATGARCRGARPACRRRRGPPPRGGCGPSARGCGGARARRSSSARRGGRP